MKQIGPGDGFPFHRRSDGSTDVCAVCNRPLGGWPAFWVEVVGGGQCHDQTSGPADADDPGYMGVWPVGTTCAKRFAQSVRITTEE